MLVTGSFVTSYLQWHSESDSSSSPHVEMRTNKSSSGSFLDIVRPNSTGIMAVANGVNFFS